MTWTTLPRSKSSNGIAYYHYKPVGAPFNVPAVLLVHGVGLRAESWCQQLPELIKHYNVYAIDLPGHGHSERFVQKQAKLSWFSDVVHDFIDTVIQAPVIIMGHSLGALISLNIAAHHLESCRAIVACNAVFQRTKAAHQAVLQRAEFLQQSADMAEAGNNECPDEQINTVSAPLLRWFGASPVDSEYWAYKLCKQWLKEGDQQAYASAYQAFAETRGANPEALKQLTQATLFLTGEQDMNSSAAMSQQMAELTPRSEAVIIPGARHMVPMTHATAVNSALLAFCQSIPE